VRTIQLVSGGVALRNSPVSGLGRTPQLDLITIQVPEPGSTLALVGALGLIGGLYGVRRRFF
ncbi:MAG TPA: PEP-CTERM sorting domain-containing protein, partial [Deltaproteobacteria bacterium]|nr:PEP-CTERM sorting domain-containing protein [Deltaproteobacteria bacterium]